MKHWQLLLAALLALPASADIYKCRLANGKTEISNAPCPTGSGTVIVRPDESVPEATRAEAERDVERMRAYVDKREAAQRADEAAARQAQAQAAAQNTAGRHYGDPDACLRELGQQVLEAGQRARLEAECRSLYKPPANNPSSVYLPAIGVSNSGNPLGQCLANAQRAAVSDSERSRRLSQCEASFTPHHHPPTASPEKPAQAPKPAAPTIVLCPPNKRNCQ